MLLFLAYVLFSCFGRDGRGCFRLCGVVGLHIGGGGCDSTPSLAGLTTDRYRYQEKDATEQEAHRFLCESFHNRSFFSCYVLFIIACIFFGKILQNKYKLYGVLFLLLIDVIDAKERTGERGDLSKTDK